MTNGRHSQTGCDFFVSYAEVDRGWAEWVAWQLEDAGHRVLIQAWVVVPGVSWVHQMHDGVQRAARTLRLLDTHAARLFERGQVIGHANTIATLWSVSLDRLQAEYPAAVQLLQLCAWLAPEPIPTDLITNHPQRLPPPLAAAAADPLAMTDTIAALTDYSLIRRTHEASSSTASCKPSPASTRTPTSSTP